MTTLVDVFRTLERRRGEFLVYDDGYRVHRHSYADVTRAARGFAARLSAAGVSKGDKVLLWGENRPEWIACYWGIQLIGAVAVPIDYRSSQEFAERIRQIVGARIVLAGDDVGMEGADLPRAADLSAVARRAKVENAESAQLIWRMADLDWSADGPVPNVLIDRDDIAQIVFTSGATAEPKGVVIRHRNILANVVPVATEIDKYKKYARPFQPIRFLNLLPLSHLFGQSMATNIPPLIDGTVVFMRSFNPHDLVRRVREWRISVIVCVPKILEVLKEHAVRIDPSATDPATGISIPARWWRYRKIHRLFGMKFWAFIVGAAPLGPALEDYWKRLGFVVIQGYGLTETAPIVTLNHPFKTNTGSVGTPIAGVEVKIAADGEILVRGENVSTGYYEPVIGPPSLGSIDASYGEVSPERPPAAKADRTIDPAGWLHTGDIGEKDANGRLFIRGRKKEMIVTPEGLNVYPDDVERPLNAQKGVVESAVVGARAAEGARATEGTESSEERVHAVLRLDPRVDAETVVRTANSQLADHQRIRSFSVWTDGPLPRTDGTKKLKRAAIKQWVSGASSASGASGASSSDPLQALLAKFTGSRQLEGATSIEGLGLSSLERVELMVALEDQFQTRIDETKFAGAKTLDDLRAVLSAAPPEPGAAEPVDFPSWNRAWPIRAIRRVSQATWILPLARIFAWVRVRGLEHLEGLAGPVVFASNHQSHFDVPVILMALPGSLRARVAPAMAKEFFKAHFFPEGFSSRQVLTNRANYYLAAFFFNTFPLPQREAGARQTLRYIGEVTGDGFSVLIFPEGVRSEGGDIKTFKGGIGMIGSRLGLPIIPVRIEGADRVLHTSWKMAKPGPVSVTFGAPMHLSGDNYAELADRVEQAVRDLPIAPLK